MLMPMPSDDEVSTGSGEPGPAPAEERGGAAERGGGAAGRDYGDVLWEPTPDTVAAARITGFRHWLADQHNLRFDGYHGLWHWSVAEPGAFWSAIWDYFGVLGQRGTAPVLAGGPMPDVRWFAGSTLNYARNALAAAAADPDRTAVIYRSEAGHSGTLSYAELDAQVARVRGALERVGVGQGDRVAAYLPNAPHALIGMLATASLGAIWTSCSPDFGAASVIDRFAQTEPAVLIAVDGYAYNGKTYDRRDQVAAIAAELPGLRAVITVAYAGTGPPAVRPGPQLLDWDQIPAADSPDRRDGLLTRFTEVPFDHPLWVLYSSGTTGLPKPIVHGHGRIVLEHLKALALHQDLSGADTFFWYTTTGWMMWNFLAGGLLVGATVLAYDGSATRGPSGAADTGALWELIAQAGVTYAGTGAPYLLACMKEGISPARRYDLSALRGVGSTGSPLPPEGFRWVYEQVAPEAPAAAGAAGPAFILGSFSGGTDLCTGFVGPNPLLPVRAGIISGCCLGAKVEAFDPAGQPVTGEVGELVVTQPMPSMPVGFWNDPGGDRYRDAYFADYPGVWRHGDWIMFLPDGGCVIYGRSDATLNRGGVRMGTSEFYRVVEQLPQVADSLVIDTGRLGEDGRLILYVVPAEGERIDDETLAQIRAALRSQLSPRHVPDEIHQVPGIPRTLSGKKLEVPVRKIMQGTPVAEAADPDALANPEVLAYFAPDGAARE